jgi:hypothetical protein
MIDERVAALEAQMRRLLRLKPVYEAMIAQDKEDAELQVKAATEAKEAAKKQKADDIAAARKAAEAQGPEALKKFDEAEAAREKAEAEKAEADKRARQTAADLAAEHAKLAAARVEDPDYVPPPVERVA